MDIYQGYYVMYYSNALIKKMASDKILAIKLEKALSGVKEQVTEQAERIQDGATRMLYYMSCLTDNYQDVCARLKSEDIRFIEAFYQLVKDRKIITDLIHTYVELLLKNKTHQQLEHIRRLLLKMSVNISIQTLTVQSLAVSITTAICLGSNMRSRLTKYTYKISSLAIALPGIYGYVQEASESAARLQIMSPTYYQALYFRKLEMMYFLVEPVFMDAGSLRINFLSDEDIAYVISRMVR